MRRLEWRDGRISERTSSRPYVRFSAQLARAICARLAAGEKLIHICADADMPSRNTVSRWARQIPRFKAIFDRAKALGLRLGGGVGSSYDPVTAHEIVVRVSQGETLTAIAEDPQMPPIWTIFHWRRSNDEFEEALTLAREALADRFADLGWRMAMEATPQTAHLTRVRLNHLRWTAAIHSPRTHGRLKAVEPPDPPEVREILFRHWRVEANKETGQIRVVEYTANPDTRQPERTFEGPWTDRPSVIHARHVARGAIPASSPAPIDPEYD